MLLSCTMSNAGKVSLRFNALSYAPQPNCKFNVDANSGHAFGILLAAVGALRPSGSGAS